MFLVDLVYANNIITLHSKLAISLMFHRGVWSVLYLIIRDKSILRHDVLTLLSVDSPVAEIVVTSPRPTSVLVGARVLSERH